MSFVPTHAMVTRGVLARLAGCNGETVRYYEKIGLLPPPQRSPGGHRLYDGDNQRRLRFILRGRELGFSIDELRSLLSLADGRGATCADVHELTVRHIAAVKRKIADLARLEATLSRIAAQCSGEQVPECPVIDALWGEEDDTESAQRPE